VHLCIKLLGWALNCLLKVTVHIGRYYNFFVHFFQFHFDFCIEEGTFLFDAADLLSEQVLKGPTLPLNLLNGVCVPLFDRHQFNFKRLLHSLLPIVEDIGERHFARLVLLVHSPHRLEHGFLNFKCELIELFVVLVDLFFEGPGGFGYYLLQGVAAVVQTVPVFAIALENALDLGVAMVG